MPIRRTSEKLCYKQWHFRSIWRWHIVTVSLCAGLSLLAFRDEDFFCRVTLLRIAVTVAVILSVCVCLSVCHISWFVPKRLHMQVSLFTTQPHCSNILTQNIIMLAASPGSAAGTPTFGRKVRRQIQSNIGSTVLRACISGKRGRGENREYVLWPTQFAPFPCKWQLKQPPRPFSLSIGH